MVGWAWPQTEDSDPASAFYAVNRGGRALEAGAREEAVRWLDRAVRLGVRARFVRFLLASALAGADEQRAEASLRDLVAEAPHFREAMVALAAARLRAGDATEAAYWLGRSLAQAAAPTDPGFPSFADRVVAAAGLPGWAGMDSAGHVQLRVSMAWPAGRAGLRP